MKIANCGYKNWYSVCSTEQKFSINLKPYPFKKMSVQDAADYTADLMFQQNPNLWLSLSGGYDSEFIANTLYRNNIKFTPIIWKDYFHRETDYAFYWCKNHKIEPVVIEKHFMEVETFNLADNIMSQLNNPRFGSALPVITASIANKNNGSIITGTGECFTNSLYPDNMNDESEFDEGDWAVDLLLPNQTHFNAFYSYTPELFYAMITNIDTSLPTQEAKSLLYNLPFRPKLTRTYVSLLNIDSTRCDFKKDYCVSLGSLSDVAKTFEEFIV